jgi:ribonuclease D
MFDGNLLFLIYFETMNSIEINPQFKQVLNFVNQTNQSVFLTGKAGTGKTTLLKYIKQNTYKQMAVIAPTGVAAINAGGSTIHSFFQFAFAPFLPFFKDNGQYDFVKMNNPTLKYNAQRRNILKQLELLVIDEISMVRSDLLDQIDYTLRIVRKKWELPFGGVQLLFIGDMHQLPPVVQKEEWKLLEQNYISPYFFDSYVIQRYSPIYIELEKIYRQTDQTFVNLLNQVRNNQLDENGLTQLNARFKSNISQSEYQQSITLTTHNRKADEINERNLQNLKSPAFKYQASVEGTFSDRNYPVDENLVLKVGTRVMFLKNNNEKNYYNGKIGVISFLSKEIIKVKCDEDKSEIEVGKENWQNITYKVENATKQLIEDVIGTFEQFPLRYAWAITIHKSQGLTFDKLIIDAAESFSAGQVYVALSRCRSIEGLTLSSKIQINTLANDKSILNFSQNKQDAKSLEFVFSASKKNYLKLILIELYDFETLKELQVQLQNIQIQHNKKIPKIGADWINELSLQINNLVDVSNKFKPQLLNLIENAQSLENDSNLNDKIVRASTYFEEKTAQVNKLLNACTLVTESKQAAQEINVTLQNLHDLCFYKNYFFNLFKLGFNFSDYVKCKMNMQYPEFKVNVYANSKNVKINEEVVYPQLFRKLILLRDEICNEDLKPIYLIASNKSLIELANFLPTTEAELTKISGFGEAKAETYGPRFLKIIKEFMDEFNVESNMQQVLTKKKKTSKKKEVESQDAQEVSVKTKVSTKEATYNMFKENFTLDEIAMHRKLALSTVQSHLIPYLANNEINISKLVSEDKQKLILKALENFKNEHGLAVVKNKLPDDISFSEIRFVMASQIAGQQD